MTESLPEPLELKELVDAASALPKVRHQRERLDRLLQDYARGRTEERGALVVALIGATGAGKSTLLNALAGARVAVEGVDRPTSREPVIYAPVDAQLGSLGGLPAKLSRYEPRRSAESWSGQVFLDTPDLNSVQTEHRRIARAALEQSDVALVVLHRGSVAEASQIDFLAEFARRRRLLFVLNFADELGASAREELKGQVRAIARQQFGLGGEEAQVLAVSALNARRGDGDAFEYPALLQALRTLGERAVADRIRTSNAMAAVRELAERVGAAAQETDQLRQGIAEEVRAGFDKAREALSSDFAGRLKAAHPHLAQQVRAQAASRWWGPAAVWMRLSALGAGGMGAAAVAARQSLPVGLAVAAASAALNAVQDKTRKHAAEALVVGAPDEDAATGQLARAAIAPARQRAIAAGMQPEALGVPELPTVLQTLTALRAECFAYAHGQAISESVSGWWKWARWLLVPLINLPLIALGGHVGYRVVRGYLEGQYVSGDYFLNALAMAALLSAAGALLASASLSYVARRARAAAQKRFEAGVETVASAMVEGVTSAMPEVRAAAARLRELSVPGSER